MNEQIPDFIQTLGNKKEDEQIVNTVTPTVSNENVPDFISNIGKNNTLETQPDIKNTEVSNELGIELETMDEAAKQAYVDGLSDKDWETWKQLRDEGYSFEARKALMENQDLLYDINKPGAKKYYSQNQGLKGGIVNLIQDSNLLYEDTIHPWSEETQRNLYNKIADLDEKYQEDDIIGQYMERLDPYHMEGVSNFQRNALIWGNAAAAKLKREGIVLEKLGLQLASMGVNFFDNLINLNLQGQANLANKYLVDEDKGMQNITIDPSQRSTVIGSYIQMVSDVFGASFVVAYPVATFMLTELADSSESVDNIMRGINNGFEWVAGEILKSQKLQNWSDKYLTEEEKQIFKDDLAQGLFIVATSLMGYGGKKFTKSELYQNWETSLKLANEFGRRGARIETGKKIRSYKELLQEKEVGTELGNESGKPIAKATENGMELTPRGSLDILTTAAGAYGKSFKEAFNWYWRNKNNRLVTRNPNSPVGELPIPIVPEDKTKVEEVKPIEETPVEVKDEIKEKPKTNLRTAKEPTKTVGEGVGTFIKRVTNDIAGTEGGLTKELVEKLKSSKELQNEYVNTIDPYLKANGTENPEGVIKDQLADFIQTAKDRLELRKINNMEFRKGQKQAGVQLTQTEKIQQQMDDMKIKNLVKILNKSQDNPEKFLQYLLNLPKDTIKIFDELIPNFSVNLNFIKDTLDITKAIVKSDIVNKFLDYKSTRGTRRKGFIKRMVYEKLRDAYRRAGVKANMQEIENMLNNLSEEEMVQLEGSMEGSDLPAFMKEDFFSQILGAEERAAFKGESTNPLKNLQKRTPKEVFKQLIQEGYIEESGDLKPFKTLDDILNFQLKNGKTVGEIADWFDITFKPKIYKELGIQGRSDLVNAIIEYRENIPELYAQFAAHEIGHHLMGGLTTAEYMDFLEGLSKATENLKEYKPLRKVSFNGYITQGPSQYPSLAKSQVGALEYGPDMIANLLTYGDINGLADYLQPYLSPELGGKVRDILNEVGKNLWDNFSTVMVNNKKFTPRDEIQKLVDKIKDPQMQKTPKNDLIKEYNKGIGYENRLSSFQEVDPNVKGWDMDLTIDSPTFGQFIMELEDGSKLPWEQYKETLSPEIRDKLYEKKDIINQTSKDIIDEAVDLPEYRGDGKFDKYKQELRNIDPDIVGIYEKDGKLYARVRFESYRERWEMASGPGMIEEHDFPLKEFVKQSGQPISEDLQKLINKYAD